MNAFLYSLLAFVIACATVYPFLFSSNDWVVFLVGIAVFALNIHLLVVVGKNTLTNRSKK